MGQLSFRILEQNQLQCIQITFSSKVMFVAHTAAEHKCMDVGIPSSASFKFFNGSWI